jgi:hypothetical protein
LAQVLSEFKNELLEFASTRLTMLQNEMREKLLIAGAALQAIAVGAALALIAALFLCVAVVAVVAMFLGGGVGAWAAAFAIVGFAFLLIGGSAASNPSVPCTSSKKTSSGCGQKRSGRKQGTNHDQPNFQRNPRAARSQPAAASARIRRRTTPAP